MRQLFTFLLVVSVAVASQAQLPKWVVYPTNDTLYVKVDNKLIQGQEDDKSLIWSMDGNLLYSSDNVIMPFNDGVATVCMKNQPVITGFIDVAGNFTAIPNLNVAYGNPFFENGFLLCSDKKALVFIGKDGTKASFPSVDRAFPFHRGYAPFFTYDQPDKKKDPHFGYFKADGTPVKYLVSLNEKTKPVEPKDIDFVSAIGSNGKGVAVIKNKFYWFDAASESFEPLLWGDEESVKKRHLNLHGDYEQYFLNLPDDTIVINAKYGKNQFAELKFDRELRPVLFSFEDEKMKFAENPAKKVSYQSDIREFSENGKFGLSFGAMNMLPEQFDKVGVKYGNRAFVKLNGKWGVLEIMPNLKYELNLNRGEDIAFRHQKFETQIRLDLPPQISAKEARIDIPESTGLLIDKTSRVTKDTESGNFVTYDCVLNIPDSLPDTVTTVTYKPVAISYDGISLFKVPISVKAWHLKYFNVDPIESETSISNGVASFTVNVNAQKNVGENDFPFEVRIEAEGISVEYEKISETRYKCLVSNLKEGVNNLDIYVTEKGCPSSVFPFEVFYSKPVPRKRQKEKVVVRKKDTVEKKPTPRLEL